MYQGSSAIQETQSSEDKKLPYQGRCFSQTLSDFGFAKGAGLWVRVSFAVGKEP